MYQRLFEFWKWAIVDGGAHYCTCVTIVLGIAVVLGVASVLVGLVFGKKK